MRYYDEDYTHHDSVPKVDLYKQTNVRATKKPHPCSVCMHTIPTGKPATYIFSVQEGKATSEYHCLGSHRGSCTFGSTPIYSESTTTS